MTEQTGNGGVPFIGVPDLLRMSMKGIDLAPLGSKLIEYAQATPDAAEALLDVSVIFQLKQNQSLAAAMMQEALKIRRVFRQPGCVEPVLLRVLVIFCDGDLMSNTPVQFLVQNSAICMNMLYLKADDDMLPEYPPHDVLFVAVAESEANLPLLEKLAGWLKNWPVPVVNRPEQIAGLSRDAVYAMLQGVPGLLIPAVQRMNRATLLTGEAKLVFPMLIRPVDSHAGHDLEKLDNADKLLAYLIRQPHDVYFLTEFVDYRQADGQFRKYRIVLMQGVPYLCHLAVSRQWMVHYLSADMLENPANRAEEAACMLGFREGFADKHAGAFAEIARRSGLDYVGIDCSETPDGQLLVFEIDSNMVVHDMDPPDLFPYKAAHMHTVFRAFQDMLWHVVYG